MQRRVSRKSRGRQASAKSREPLAEGIVPLDKRGRRSWASMSDNEIVSFTQTLIRKQGLMNRTALQKACSSLYVHLTKRALLEKIKFESDKRSWKRYDDKELVIYAQNFVDRNLINSSGELQRRDRGLYTTLWKRKLLQHVDFPEKKEQRNWPSKDGELLGYALKFIEKNGIKTKTQLYKKDGGLYAVLRKRELLGKLKLKNTHRDWASMSDKRLLQHAKKFIVDKGIENRTELGKKDSGLHAALRARGLIDRLKFRRSLKKWTALSDGELIAYAQNLIEEKRLPNISALQKHSSVLYIHLRKRKLFEKIRFGSDERNWGKYDDEKLVEYAQKFVDSTDSATSTEFRKRDGSLYYALWKRKLLDRLIFKKRLMKWASMSDEELVAFTKKFMKKNGISGRAELGRKSSSLYTVLLKRKLLDEVGFEDKRRKGRPWRKMSDDELIAFTRKFIKEKGISGRIELQKVDGGLYSTLQRRKLLDKVGFEEKRRDWSSFSDAQLVEHARQSIGERGITGRAELAKADSGLYSTLLKRKLIGRVFEDIDQAKEREEAQALFDGLAEFGGAG